MRSVAIAVALALTIRYARAAEPSPHVQKIEWFEGERFFWDSAFRHDTYADLRERLPHDQSRVAQELSRFDLAPLDIGEGNERPRISYIYGTTGETAVYANIRGLISLDLSGYHGSTPLDLRPLQRSAIQIIVLPEASGNNEQLSSLLLARSSLPKLRHIDVYPRRGAITADLIDSLAKRGGIPSLQLSGPNADDAWLARLPKVDSLKCLRLYRASVSAQGLKSLSQIHDLTSLAIVECSKLNEGAISALGDCPKLRELQLSDSSLGTPLYRTISQLNRIERLAIDTPDIPRAALKDLLSMKALTTLVVRSNDVAVRSALDAWCKQKKGRRAFLNADLFFGGWIGDPNIFWKHPRAIEPEHFP
jgi:hypothetical protein